MSPRLLGFAVALAASVGVVAVAEESEAGAINQGLVLEMSRLADNAYVGGRSAPEGWSVLVTANTAAQGFNKGGQDIAVLYQHRVWKSCTIAFSGTNDEGDWAYNLWIAKTDLTALHPNLSGVLAHSGFMQKVREFMSSLRWSDFSSHLVNSCPRNNISAVGHSLGGAVAALFTGVVNHLPGSSVLPRNLGDDDGDASNDGPIQVPNVQISLLFTYGAPGVTFSKQLTNPNNTNVPGARVFNFGPSDYDLVTATNVVGLLHPKMEAAQLSKASNGMPSLQSYVPGSSRDVTSLPNAWDIWGLGASVLVHPIREYYDRLNRLSTR